MEQIIANLPKEDKTISYSKFEDWHPKELNEFALSVTKYFKSQTSYSSKEPFTDPLFPPNENSLLGTIDLKGNQLEDIIKSKGKKEITKSKIQDFNEIIWLRASEIFEGKNYAVFETSIEASDVKQGYLGNCYFLSTLACMCKYPQLIMQIFRTPFVTENNCYEICFRINGVWKVVVIDDYIPCDKSTKKPIFAQPSGNEIWVMLVEKAWAKVNGGYNHTVGGQSFEVLETLTNFPSFEYNLTSDCEVFVYNFLKMPRPSQEERNCGSKKKMDSLSKEIQKTFWSKILQCVKDEVFMYSYSKKVGNGIVANHAYSFLDAKERKVNGELIRLVKLRNPWGTGEWQGEWSDQCPKWTQEAKEAFEQKEFLDDGSFYIPFASYLEYFDYFGVCDNLDPICSRTKTFPKASEDSKDYVFDFFLPKKSHVNISVFRKNPRFNKKIDKFARINLGLVIAKKSESQTNLVEYVEVRDNNLHFRTELEAGSYLILPQCSYNRTYEDMGNEFYNYDKFRKITIDVSANNFFDLTYIGIDSTHAGNSLQTKKKITPMFFKKKYLFSAIKPKEAINSGYNFLGRYIKFKSNPYVVKFDPYLQAVHFYSKKFPKEMSYLNKLEKIENRNESVRPKGTNFVYQQIWRDVFYLGEYIPGECSFLCLNGLGILVYKEEGLCYGYFKEGKQHGLFTYVDMGVTRRINFNHGKPEGDAELHVQSNDSQEVVSIPMTYEILKVNQLRGSRKSRGKNGQETETQNIQETGKQNMQETDKQIPGTQDEYDYLWHYFNADWKIFNDELCDVPKYNIIEEEDLE